MKLRHRILREPLGLAYSTEDIAAESEQYHFCGFLNGEVAAGLIFQHLGGEDWKMRQVAVAQDRQRGGVGRTLVRFGETFVSKRGGRRISLNARETVVEFYVKLGYRVTSPDSFLEIGIPHFTMEKMIR